MGSGTLALHRALKRLGINSRFIDDSHPLESVKRRGLSSLSLAGLNPDQHKIRPLTNNDECVLVVTNLSPKGYREKVRSLALELETTFLEIDICRKEPWNDLTSFLGLPIPDLPFPSDDRPVNPKIRKWQHIKQISRIAGLNIRNTLWPETRRIIRRFTMVSVKKAASKIEYSAIDPIEFETPLFHDAKRFHGVPKYKKGRYRSHRAYVAYGEKWLWDSQTGALLDSRHRFIRESTKSTLTLWQKEASIRHQNPDIHIPGTSSIFQCFHRNYYHTLIDNLPRLHLLEVAARTMKEPVKLFIRSPLNSTEERFLPMLLPENVELREVPSETQLVEFERFVYTSAFSNLFNGSLPRVYLDRFLSLAFNDRPIPIKKRRILISRIATSLGGQRCIYNEDRLFEALEPMGFERFILENMSFEEQIDLFRSAEIVVAAHGAGITNMIFADRAALVEIFPSDFLIPHYYYLALSLDSPYRCVFSKGRGYNANFFVNIKAVIHCIKEVLPN